MKNIYEFFEIVCPRHHLPLCNIEKGIWVPTWQCQVGKTGKKNSKAKIKDGRFGSQHLADRQSVLTLIILILEKQDAKDCDFNDNWMYCRTE